MSQRISASETLIRKKMPAASWSERFSRNYRRTSVALWPGTILYMLWERDTCLYEQGGSDKTLGHEWTNGTWLKVSVASVPTNVPHVSILSYPPFTYLFVTGAKIDKRVCSIVRTSAHSRSRHRSQQEQARAPHLRKNTRLKGRQTQ